MQNFGTLFPLFFRSLRVHVGVFHWCDLNAFCFCLFGTSHPTGAFVMAIDVTPAAQRRRLSRFPAPSPRPSSQLAAPSTPAATPPPNKASRKSRLSTIVYTPPDSASPSPSLSAPPPFDWDAARSNAAPPYGLPGNPAKTNAAAGSPGGDVRTPKKRIFRKATVLERFVQTVASLSRVQSLELR